MSSKKQLEMLNGDHPLHYVFEYFSRISNVRVFLSEEGRRGEPM